MVFTKQEYVEGYTYIPYACDMNPALHQTKCNILSIKMKRYKYFYLERLMCCYIYMF